MGRVLYALVGDSGGHLRRGLTLAGLLEDHEFLFVGANRALEAKKWGYQVEELPMIGTYYKNNRVDLPKTIIEAAKALLFGGSIIKRAQDIIERYDPDIIITDYERFIPLAAKQLDRPCYSLDNQHLLTHCAYHRPAGHNLNRFMTTFSVSKLFSEASHYFITSFFDADPIDPNITEIYPPLIRPDLDRFEPKIGEHGLVYQTSPTFEKLLPKLREIDQPFYIYGLGVRPREGNLIFKGPSNDEFLSDLASCRYCVVNGGHNVISEALVFNKPIFCFPIENAYEQLINAYYLRRLNYGDYSYGPDPGKADLKSFMSELDSYGTAMKNKTFNGNSLIKDRIETIISR